MPATILVTGGLGYIGSHTTVELIAKGFKVIIIDNLSNSEPFILNRIEQITGTKPLFYQHDLCDINAVRTIFSENEIDVVIHFAAYKSVSESVKAPLKYFQNNLQSLMNVLQAMQESKVKHIVFSSSATVYGEPDQLPVTETAPFKKALSAYGSTKQMGEEILEKICDTGTVKNISLRYFNPVGAHVSALIGELPKGVPNNLFPFVTQTASGKIKQLTVFGDDYDTPDGSCIRDYIHVVDLAKAHVQACKRLIEEKANTNFEVFNIGTGKGTSVLEMIHAFEGITDVKLNYIIGARREGDAPAVFASTDKANELLYWRAELDLGNMITTAWKWQLQLDQQMHVLTC
jgi:UDP-glucose 4-epimerase